MLLNYLIFIIMLFFSFIFFYFTISRAEGINVFSFSTKSKAFTSAFLGLASVSFILLEYRTIWEALILGMLYGFLLFNSLSDLYSRNVYTGFSFLFLIIGNIYQYFILQNDIKLLLIFLLTSIFFHFIVLHNMYGSGDAKIFFLVSLFYKIPEPSNLIFHLFLALLFFTIVNIGEKKQKKYKLENPKAFVPYIAATALIFI